MGDKNSLIEKIRSVFGGNEYPGDPFLQGIFEGSEPYDEVGAFKGKTEWASIEAEFLDAHAAALSFFSEAAFRFYFPAYLIADLNSQLRTADPLFHLTHGFSDISVNVPVKDRVFVVKTGKSQFVNPRRYGAATFFDHARYRLSIFTREEASAIVDYLEFKRDSDPNALDNVGIDAALDLFWRERAKTAPLAERLVQYIAQQQPFSDAIPPDAGNNSAIP